jgi:hypothetical protein
LYLEVNFKRYIVAVLLSYLGGLVGDDDPTLIEPVEAA